METSSSYRENFSQLLSLFHLIVVANPVNQCFSNFEAETTNLGSYFHSMFR